MWLVVWHTFLFSKRIWHDDPSWRICDRLKPPGRKRQRKKNMNGIFRFWQLQKFSMSWPMLAISGYIMAYHWFRRLATDMMIGQLKSLRDELKLRLSISWCRHSSQTWAWENHGRSATRCRVVSNIQSHKVGVWNGIEFWGEKILQNIMGFAHHGMQFCQGHPFSISEEHCNHFISRWETRQHDEFGTACVMLVSW